MQRVHELPAPTLRLIHLSRNDVQGDEAGKELLKVLQAALHDRFVQRLGLTWARGSASCSQSRLGGLLRLLWAVLLVLDKVCEATFKGVTSMGGFSFKHLTVMFL